MRKSLTLSSLTPFSSGSKCGSFTRKHTSGKKKEKRLERIMFNIESITENFRENDEAITNILSNFSLISDTLAKANLAGTLSNVNSVLSRVDAITTKIDNGTGSVGLLVNDNALYNNLNKSATQLNALIEDLKLNPYRYVNFSIFPPSKKRMEYAEPVK